MVRVMESNMQGGKGRWEGEGDMTSSCLAGSPVPLLSVLVI